MTSTRKIAIVYPASVPWMGQFIDGLRRYAVRFGGWRLYTTPPSHLSTGESALSISSFVGWDGDAVITAVSNEGGAAAARALGLPVVNISSWNEESFGLARVAVDSRRAGELAAEHLVSKGLRQLAFVGWAGVHYSEEREAGFVRRARELGVEVVVRRDDPDAPSEENWGARLRHLSGWLRALPRPCGVFAVHDYRAQLVLDACDAADIRVPHDLAVMGMDNDVIVCRHSTPTITSISRNPEAVGWETAVLLQRIFEGEVENEAAQVWVAPDEVVARESTDTHFHADDVVRVAQRYIERRLRHSFNIEEVARHAGVSKRKLEMRFRETLGKSPHQVVTEARIARAREMLGRPEGRSLQAVAVACGFASYSAFVSAFRKITGVTPRKEQRRLESGRPWGGDGPDG